MDLPDLARAVAADPNDAEARLKLGEALTESGRGDEAIDHLRKALMLRKEYVEAYLALGRALDAEQEQIAAIATLEGGFELARQNGRTDLAVQFEEILARLGPGKRARGAGGLDEEAFSRAAQAALGDLVRRIKERAPEVTLQYSPSVLVLDPAGRGRMGLSEQRSSRELWCTSGLGELKFRYIQQTSHWRAGGGEELVATVADFLTRQLGRTVSLA